jgi:serine/threonine protein phosphatase PrpC
VQFLTANAQHIGSRPNQQDAFGFSDPNDDRLVRHGGFLSIVADGMGGLAYGDLASKMAVKAFLDSYRAKDESEAIADALERAAYAANEAVWMMAAQAGVAGDVGTTLVGAVAFGSTLYWVSVGDSAVYLLRDGKLSLLNTSHVYGRDLDARAARGEITVEQALGDPQRDALTSYIGKRELKLVDHNLNPIILEAGDRILLATDGLFKTLPEEEIAAVLSTEGSHAAEALVSRVIERKRDHQDNVTVVTVDAVNELPAAIGLPEAAGSAGARRPRSMLPLVAAAVVVATLAAAGALWWYARG